MTLKIEIEIPQGEIANGGGSQYLRRAMSVLGYTAQTATPAIEAAYRDAAISGMGVTETGEDGSVKRVDPAEVYRDAPMTATEAAAKAEPLDTRPVGSPSEGKSRRNSAEKTEDDALEALAATKGVSTDQLNGAIAQAGRVEAKAALEARGDSSGAAETLAISTGESRVGPEDDPEAEAADAADEAAETAKTGLAPIDELRRAVGAYQKKFGMPAAVALCAEDGIIGCGAQEVPEEDIPEMIARVQAAMGAAPAEAKTETKEAAKPATKADVQAAMLRYAKKFDGQDTDMEKMPFTMSDCPKIFTAAFGPGITKLSHVPEDGYAKAIAGIEEAIQKNPFKRGL